MKNILRLIGLMLIAQCAYADKDETVATVMKDGYFRDATCENYLVDDSDDDKDKLTQASNTLEILEVQRYVAGLDSILTDFEIKFKGQGVPFNSALQTVRDRLKGKTVSLQSYSDDGYSPAKVNDALKAWTDLKKAAGRTSEQKQMINDFMFCRVAMLASGLGVATAYAKKFEEMVQSHQKSGQIGFFYVTAEKAEYGKKVGTGNQFAEPKAWDGSRFITVFASFKNTDTESRQPEAGSLFINYDGKEYEYDSVEPILLEGYNIWFRQINPLITMKTRIVYRIPDEVSGEIFWKPGRNPDNRRLWLGYIKAAQ